MTDKKTPLETFEDFGRKLFSIAKKRAKEAEESVEEVIEKVEHDEPTLEE